MRLLLLLFPFLLFAQDTLTVEMAARKDDGEVLIFISPERRNLVWAEMIIRGTHENKFGNIPFNADLFQKYFRRVIQLKSGKIDTVMPVGCFRQHTAPNIVRAADVEVKSLYDNPKQVWQDIQDAKLGPLPMVKDWPWGTKEKEGYTLAVTTELTTIDLVAMQGQRFRLDPDSLKTAKTQGILATKKRIRKSWLKPLE